MKLEIKKECLNYWDHLTELNHHTERLTEIARECAAQLETGGHYAARMFRDLEALLEDNYSEHMKFGHLPNHLYVQREAYRLALWNFIKVYFDNGNEAAETIRP